MFSLFMRPGLKRFKRTVLRRNIYFQLTVSQAVNRNKLTVQADFNVGKMDQSVAIQETLDVEENCLIAVQCLLLLNNGIESRLLGLVEHDREHALFLYSHRRMAITGNDVNLQEIIPISYDFSVAEVSSPDELAVVGADTRVRVTFLNKEMELKLPFGSHTRLFLTEVNRAWSDVCEQYPSSPKFAWLTKYEKNFKDPGLSTPNSIRKIKKRGK